MNNAEKFKQIFGLYATELWSMPEGDFLAWLNRDVETTQIDHDADTGKKVCVDTISRQAALDAIIGQPPEPHYPSWYAAQIEKLPSAQPDRDVIDDCLRHIYKNISVHTATGGVIAIRYYMEKLYEEIYGEGERPWWMT